jgi:lipopolysaccharide export system permease protein
MKPGTLARYFGLRFFSMVAATFAGLFLLVLLIDFLEIMRRTSDQEKASALLLAQISLYRVPHITERLIPFTVLIGAMVCYLNLSRRLELVVARAAGISAWQFIKPATVIALLTGTFVTTVYNPTSAYLRERSAQLETRLTGWTSSPLSTDSGFWVRQRNQDGQSIINAAISRQQGAELAAVTIFNLDRSDNFVGRIEAKRASLQNGFWKLEDARIFTGETVPVTHAEYELKTNLSRAQVQESLATPETVPFWQLPILISLAESSGLAAVSYRLQYYQLLAMPFYLVAMVLLAGAVSLRTFRFGGVQRMVLSGIAAGFLLFLVSKITGDLSKASLLAPAWAALLPPFLGGITGFLALLYEEDG